MNCEICNREFIDNSYGLAEMTFHVIITHGSED